MLPLSDLDLLFAAGVPGITSILAGLLVLNARARSRAGIGPTVELRIVEQERTRQPEDAPVLAGQAAIAQ